MTKRQLLLLSSSKVHGYGLLEFARKDIEDLLSRNNVSTVLFVPYALSNHDEYLKKMGEPFKSWGYNLEGIHRKNNPVEAVKKCEAIFIGGGNTFRLLKALYDNKLISSIRQRVLEDGIPYIGASAGTNVATRSIHTTNDMPITYPPSFEALKLVPFNVNPHFLDADPNSKHMGESREERIKQYHEETESYPVLGLREGAILHVDKDCAVLKGCAGAKVFEKGKEAVSVELGADLSWLLNGKPEC